MEDNNLDQKPSVLIVDRSEETREVLQTALNLHGVKTFAAKHTAEGVELSWKYRPDLIVFDLDVENVDSEGIFPSFWSGQDGNNVPIILLGTFRRGNSDVPGREFVSKPYHFKPLIRRIEELLKSEV
jgi:DNA-binding response OmpR family regulator